MTHSIRLCSGTDCGLRFPAPTDDERVAECPLCEAPTSIVQGVPEPVAAPVGQPTRTVVAILDNLRSALNAGTILRAAEGAGMAHVYVCGFTPTPENPKVLKTSLGSELTIGWSRHLNALDAITLVRAEGYEVWALEATSSSTLLSGAPAPSEAPRVAFIVGNEVAGVDPALLERADRVLHLPMQGTKTSLNVGVAFGIAAYQLSFGTAH